MNKKVLLSFFLSTFILLGCSTNDDNAVPAEVKTNDFVWKGLNLYYLWQEQVPNLDDDRFANQNQLNTYLKGFSNPSELFNSLLYQKGITDKFSVIYDDYNKLEQVLSGTVKNNGVDYALYRANANSDQVIGWVRYILPNSDASNKDIHRGDIFYAVNGTQLNLSNYQSLLNLDSYQLSLANYNSGNFTPNGRTVSLVKTEYSENPVYYSSVITQGSRKIGYLVYNGFYANYESELNAAFSNLKSSGVNELILDLRYNSGGSVATATRLASMITGQFTNQIFAKQQWNSKLEQAFADSGRSEEFINRFTNSLANGNSLNSLNLSRVYVLTTSSTASASELVINGLKPYINVIQIGDTTIGKNVGSITLYDSPNYGKNNRNPSHKYAMQPLVLKIVNSQGFGDYTSGLTPDYVLTESLDDAKELGDPEELFLNHALGIIQGNAPQPKTQNIALDQVGDSKALNSLRTQMYIDPIK